MSGQDGKFIKSEHLPAYCEKCGKVTEHVMNVFENATYLICQTCATATVSRRKEKK